MQAEQMDITSWNENTGEPRVWKLTSAVRGRAGGKGPNHRYLACCLSYYNLDEPLPDHSSLTRIRERYGVELFQRFFEAIVDQCQQAGLVWGKELYVDATKVHANAYLDSVKPRFAVDMHLRELFSTGEGGEPEQAPQVESSLLTSEAATSHPETNREEATPFGEAPVPAPSVGESTAAAPVPLPVHLEDAMREDLTRTNEQRHDWIEQTGRPQREVTRGSYRRLADFVVSTTDPDATLMPTKGQGRHLGYHTHYVVDGGKSRIILAALVTPSEVMENQPMRGSASSERASAGNCGRARSLAIPRMAPSKILWRWKISTYEPMYRCPILTNEPRSMASRRFATIMSGMSTSVPTMPSYHYTPMPTMSGRNATRPTRRPVTRVPSSRSAPPVSRDACSNAVSMRNTSSKSAPIM